jgi:hypothetical protein
LTAGSHSITSAEGRWSEAWVNPYLPWRRRTCIGASVASTDLQALQARMAGRIQIYIAPDCRGLPDRVELSCGTRPANVRETTNRVGGFAYEEGSRLPREPWRRPSGDEANSLITTEPPQETASSVSIVKLPGEFSDGVREAITGGTNENVLRLLGAICRIGEPVHCIGAGENLADLETVTVNHAKGEYIGIHVDTWDGLDVRSLHHASNRICINMGRSDRYFLFLPFSVTDAARLLAEELGPEWETPARHTEIGRQFMARFPNVPVIRCRVGPGEGYIAPTENLFHDGSSIGQSYPDQVFTVRGRIRPLSCVSADRS